MYLSVASRLSSYRKCCAVSVAAGMCIAISSLTSPTILAAELVQVEKAEVAVIEQSSKVERQALKSAFRQFVLKLVGHRQLLDNPDIKTLLRSPNQYLRTYRYERNYGQLYYIAEFDTDAVQDYLLERQLPVWGKRRPTVVLWIVEESDDGERSIVSDSTLSTTRNGLVVVSRQRGLPFTLPLMDLDDALAITDYDVWGRFEQPVRAASERYNPDVIVVARLYPNVKNNVNIDTSIDTESRQLVSNLPDYVPAFGYSDYASIDYYLGDDDSVLFSSPAFSENEFNQLNERLSQGQYTLDWTIYGNSSPITGNLVGDDTEVLLQSFVQQIADNFGQRLAIVNQGNNEESSELVISIANLDSMVRLVSVMDYLSSLTLVGDVKLLEQQGSVSQISVSLYGTKTDFNSILALDGRLNVVTDTFGQPVEGAHYYWSE